MYCCLRREPHFLCSILNDTLAFDSADEYRLTGTETRPNEMFAPAMALAGIKAGLKSEDCRRKIADWRRIPPGRVTPRPTTLVSYGEKGRRDTTAGRCGPPQCVSRQAVGGYVAGARRH